MLTLGDVGASGWVRLIAGTHVLLFSLRVFYTYIREAPPSLFLCFIILFCLKVVAVTDHGHDYLVRAFLIFLVLLIQYRPQEALVLRWFLLALFILLYEQFRRLSPNCWHFCPLFDFRSCYRLLTLNICSLMNIFSFRIEVTQFTWIFDHA